MLPSSRSACLPPCDQKLIDCVHTRSYVPSAWLKAMHIALLGSLIIHKSV